MRPLVLRRLFHDRLPVATGELVGGLTITDPLVLYKSYLTRQILRHDHQQMRCMVELQKLYHRVRDYQPVNIADLKVKQMVRTIRAQQQPKRFFVQTGSRSLVTVQSDIDELRNFPSPQGLLINGSVGSGKTMLVDMFATCLPHSLKGRWHYQNFILWIFRQIHEIQQQRRGAVDDEFILLEIATRLVLKNTILIMDEFMLPDIASAKVVKIVFTYFFKMGGVLVATSNKLPEELYSSDFNKTQFKDFEQILKMRCELFDMNSKTDYRVVLEKDEKDSDFQPYLVVKQNDPKEQWEALQRKFCSGKSQPAPLVCYGRTVSPPYHCEGTVRFDFSEICNESYGPGDYILFASRYHTFIIDNVPVLTTKLKNDARRFITLLDALYEARCQLVLRTDVGLDELFFPDIDRDERASVLEEEMFARTQIQLANPYRPNTTSYETADFEVEKDVGKHQKVDFAQISKFTGEDEMFAYKRAISRLKEMTFSQTWRDNALEKWIQLSGEMTPWEGKLAKEEWQIDKVEDETRVQRVYERAPMFKAIHIWSMGLWGEGAKLKDRIARRWISSGRWD